MTRPLPPEGPLRGLLPLHGAPKWSTRRPRKCFWKASKEFPQQPPHGAPSDTHGRRVRVNLDMRGVVNLDVRIVVNLDGKTC